MGNRWAVRKIPADHPNYAGLWGIYDTSRSYPWLDGPILHDVADTLIEAHTYATQLAVSDDLFEPGGLTWLSALKGRIRRLEPPVLW